VDIKLIELRDSATLIPMIAIRLAHRTPAERFLLRRAGYGDAQIELWPDTEPYILFGRLEGGSEFHYDPYGGWSNPRTFGVAHKWLIEHWSEVQSGDVVDVEFILGEKPTKKQSESLTVREYFAGK
jgi:hypothetical protein